MRADSSQAVNIGSLVLAHCTPILPELPRYSLSPSCQLSTRLKYGSTSAKDQPRAPFCAQRS